MKKIAISTFLFSLFLGGSFSNVSAQGDDNMRAKSIETPANQAVILQESAASRAEEAATRKHSSWMMSEMGVSEAQMDQILAISHTYSDKIAWIQDGDDSIEGKRSKILRLKKLKEQEILAVLTPDQRAKYVELKEEKKREASAKMQASRNVKR